MGTSATAIRLDLATELGHPNESKGKPFYRPELDVLRFFAFLGVYSAHIYRDHFVGRFGGRFGVNLFFTLSAYLITELLRRERSKTGSIDLPKFYLRRVLRIWPLYIIGVTLAVIGGFVYRPWHVSLLWLMGGLFFSANWFTVLYGWPLNRLLIPLWTISVEEQFYLLVPSVQKFGGAKVINVFSWSILVISYFCIGFLLLGHNLYQNSLIGFQYFAVGSLLANYLDGSVPKIKAFYRVAMFLGGCSCWYVANSRTLTDLQPLVTHFTQVTENFFVMSGVLLIFLSFLGTTIGFSKWLVYLGTISYGLYMYHMLSLVLVGLALKKWMGSVTIDFSADLLSLGLTIGMAALSYRWIETPFILLKKRFELVRSRA